MRIAKRVFVLLVVVGLGFLGYYGTRTVYHARVFIELKPGDAVLGGGRVATGEYFLGGGSYSQYARDDSGRIYLVVTRGRERGVVVFGSEGKLQREIRLRRLKPDDPWGFPEQLGVSPSGRRLWTVNHAQDKHRQYILLIVYCYSDDGRELQHWPAGWGNNVEYFSAVKEDSAYLWDGSSTVATYTLGKMVAPGSPVLRETMWLAPDGWIWVAKSNRANRTQPFQTVEIWKERPGVRPFLWLTTTLPAPGDVLPFQWDPEGDLYVWVGDVRPDDPVASWHKRVYRVWSDGRIQDVLRTRDLLDVRGTHECIGRILSADNNGSVCFETGWNYTNDRIYRIYKAERIPRWRGWLLDLGVK